MSILEPTVAVVNHVAPAALPSLPRGGGTPRGATIPADFLAAMLEMEALPETLADVTDAYTVGVDDAEHGRRCDPLKHYAKLGDIEQYVIGWKDATAALHDELEATIDDVFAPADEDERQYEPLDADEQGRCDRNVEEYLDFLADQEWIRYGL